MSDENQIFHPLSGVNDKIVFVRDDGTMATGAVGSRGTDKDGNLVFWEIQKLIDNGIVNGKKKFKRIQIQRVFPCLPVDDEEQA